MRNIFIIMKKELKRFFTDRRMLIAMYMPGIVLYFIYSLMGNFMGGALSTDENYVYKIGVCFERQYIEPITEAISENFEIVEYFLKGEATDDFNDGKIDILITREERNGKDMYKIAFNSTIPESVSIYSSVYSALFNSSVSEYNYYVTAEDCATEEDMSKMLITMLLPMLTLVFLFTGCMAVAPESIAGEKERGTIATILITPIKRSHVALGKVFALSLTALASAMVSFVAVIASIPKLMSGASGIDVSVSLNIGVIEYLSLFVVIVLTVLMFTVILSIISTMAKSIKEASTYATPVMVLVTIVGVLGFVTEGTTATALYLIPIYNSVAMISSIFAMSFNPLGLLLFALSDLVVIALGTFILAKMFSSEKIMFNK